MKLHFHILLLDGVFAEPAGEPLRFHAAAPPIDQAIAQLLVTIRERILRHLARCGWAQEPSDAADRLGDAAPLLGACYSTSIGRRRTLGARAGAPLARIGADARAPRLERRGRLQAHVDGFDLHAALRVAA